jgi:hypothetical protein
MTATARPVVVTLTGTAKPLDHDPNKVRVSLTDGGVLIVDADALDVRLTYLDPEREWADGDVVAGKVTVWTRAGGKWSSVNAYGVSTALDSDIDHALQMGQTRVLRYQAGGDA